MREKRRTIFTIGVGLTSHLKRGGTGRWEVVEVEVIMVAGMALATQLCS